MLSVLRQKDLPGMNLVYVCVMGVRPESRHSNGDLPEVQQSGQSAEWVETESSSEFLPLAVGFVLPDPAPDFSMAPERRRTAECGDSDNPTYAASFSKSLQLAVGLFCAISRRSVDHPAGLMTRKSLAFSQLVRRERIVKLFAVCRWVRSARLSARHELDNSTTPKRVRRIQIRHRRNKPLPARVALIPEQNP
jgi:hypothetical protein